MSFQKLGIGTRNPNKTLDVSGSVHISETVDISDNVTVDGGLTVGSISASSYTSQGTVSAQTFSIGSQSVISGSRQITATDVEVKSSSGDSNVLIYGETGNIETEGTLTVDTINEKTTNNGVVIESVTLNNGGISASSYTSQGTVSAQTFSIGGQGVISATRQITSTDVEVKSSGGDSNVLIYGETGNIATEGTLTVDTINEKTTNNGVVIESVTLNNGAISASSYTSQGTVSAQTFSIGGQGVISATRQITSTDVEVKSSGGDSNVLIYGETGNIATEGTLMVDTINEKTTNNGVVIESVTLKDGSIDAPSDINVNSLTIGRGSGTNTSTNTAIGYQSLFNNTTGTNNTATGYNALLANTTGKRNTANGHEALKDSTGSWNTAVGYNSLDRLNSGWSNIAVGHLAGNDVLTSNKNIFLGVNTGVNNIEASYSESVAIGTLSKITASNQIMLGRSIETVQIPGDLDVTGTVSGITSTMVGLGNVDNTADTDKPVSTDQQTALNLKANLDSPTFTGTVSGITKTMIDLGNVENTTDADKEVSTATSSALALKANLASPTFTGTVGGLDKSMVALGNVENTSDLSKPVSTLTLAALGLKANLASPTFTGKTTFADVSMNGNVDISGSLTVTNQNNTTIINTTVNEYTSIVTEDISLNGELSVSGDSSFGGTVNVTSIGDSILKITGDNANSDESKHPYLIFQQDGNYNEAGIFLGAGDTSNHLTISASTGTSGGNILFKTDTTSGQGDDISNLEDAPIRMTITNSGDVGIGTTSPSAKLEVNGDCSFNNIKLQGQQVYSQRLWEVDLTGLSTSLFYPVIFTELPSLLPINFKVTGSTTQAASAAYNDNTIIGSMRTGGWSDKNVFYNVHQRVYDTNERRFIGIYTGNKDENTCAIYMRGGFGYSIMTDSPNVALYSNGYEYSDGADTVSYQIKNLNGSDSGTASSNITRRIDLTTGYSDQQYTSGSVDATSYNASSDYRIKENIVNISDTSYNIDKLRPVTYKNTKSNNQDFGVIAHELQEQIPFLVTGKKDGETHQSVNYNGLIGLLIHEVQQLKKRNSYTLDQNTILQSQLDNIMTILNTNNLS